MHKYIFNPTKHSIHQTTPIDRRPINNDKIRRGFYWCVAHTTKPANHNEKVSNWKRGLIKVIKSIMRQKYIKSHSEFTMVYFWHSGRYKENGHDSDRISLPPSFMSEYCNCDFHFHHYHHSRRSQCFIMLNDTTEYARYESHLERVSQMKTLLLCMTVFRETLARFLT